MHLKEFIEYEIEKRKNFVRNISFDANIHRDFKMPVKIIEHRNLKTRKKKKHGYYP